MAAGFSIVISATDSASKTIDGVNKRIAAMQAPTQRLQKSLDRFGELSGLKTVGKGFQDISRHALSSFMAVARMVEPLAAITGAASIAGMYQMVTAWDQFGSKLGFASARIGITAGQLQGLEGAAQLAGASSGTLTTGLQNLGQTMYDAVGGRAPETVALMNQLGVAFQDGNRHALSVTEVLPKVADKIAAIHDPYVQARIATQLFGGAAEDLLPFLRRGSDGIAEYTAKARAYGVMNQNGVEAANKLRQAQVGVTLAVEGLTNSIAQRLAPILGQFLDWLSALIVANKDWIATGIGDAFKQFAAYVEQIDFKQVVADVKSFALEANSVVQSLGGWRTVLEGIIAIKLGGWALSAIAPLTSVLRLLALIPGSGVAAGALASVGIPAVGAAAVAVPLAYGLSKAVGYDPTKDHSTANMRAGTGRGSSNGPTHEYGPNIQARQAQAMAALTGLGYTAAQAAGLTANFTAESNLNAGAVGDGGQAFGIGQWHADRQAAFAAKFGHPIQQSNLAEQLQFSDYELHTTEKGALGHLQAAGSAGEAGAAISRYYERPAAVDEAAGNRAQLATDLFNNFKPGDGAPGASGKVDVNVKVSTDGAPAKVTSKSSGGVSQPKIAMAGVGAGGL